ncbi:MAG: GuaB1 family IMP dehydrogenase-related protein [Myxococcales bacterium]|nr:GuaB1 family IMP dehydrogenase-related protein [Myxococcales bacterium]
MRFLHPERDQGLELSLEDVFLVPQYFDGISRLEVDLCPVDYPGSSNPLVSANMNAVTGKRMAETVSRHGGLGILPQDMEVATVRRIVDHIKSCDPRYDTPLTVFPDAPLRDVLGIIRKRSHDLVIVVDHDQSPIGVLTHADLRDHDQYTPASAIMSTGLIRLEAGISNRDAYLHLHEARVKAAPVVDPNGKLLGVLTRDQTVRLEMLQPSLNTSGNLMVGAAIGINDRANEQARALLDAGVDVLVLDTAHGHQRRMIESIQRVRSLLGPEQLLVAGNVCTPEGTEALIEAGADVVKVNVGPGAMCTTRMQTGVGRPTFTTVQKCAEVAKKRGRHIWADGGVRHPRDVALYLAAGASRVMIGTWLAGTYESPGDIYEDSHSKLYKENYGMASARAVRERTIHLDPFEQAKKSFFGEGISSSRIFLRPGFESVGSIFVEIITGLQSSLTYSGAHDLPMFAEKALVGVQTRGGYAEGTPHGKEWK